MRPYAFLASALAATMLAACGAPSSTTLQPVADSMQVLTLPADPMAQIEKVSDQIWTAMTSDGLTPNLQAVSSTTHGPKYVFLNRAIDASQAGTLVYRAGSYSLDKGQPEVAMTILASAANRQRSPEEAAAASAIKAALQDQDHATVTSLVLASQGAGVDKYQFVAFGDDQQVRSGSTMTMNWYYLGTYAVSAKKTTVDIAIGEGHTGTLMTVSPAGTH